MMMAILCQRWVVSVDIGGSSARGIWCAWPGGPWGRIQVRSQNFRSLNDDTMEAFLNDLRAELPREFGEEAPAVWLLGAAGAEPLLDVARVGQALQAIGLKASRVVVCTDFEANWAAALGGHDGVISVNGTGSVLYGRVGPREVRVGGWGFLFDSVPSGAAMGRLAVQALLAFWEGERQFRHFGEVYNNRYRDHPRTREGLLRLIYSSSSPQRVLGELGPVFVEAHRAGNQWAAKRLEYALNAWVAQMGRMNQELRADAAVGFVGVGSLWSSWPEFRQMALDGLEQRYPRRFREMPLVCDLAWGPLIRDLLDEERRAPGSRMQPTTGDWRQQLNDLRSMPPTVPERAD